MSAVRTHFMPPERVRRAKERTLELIFTTEEHEIITEILEEHHRELLREICRPEHREFRAVLRRREELVQDVLNKLAKFASAA